MAQTHAATPSLNPVFVCGATKEFASDTQDGKAKRTPTTPTSLDFLQRQTENISHLFDGLFSASPSLNEPTATNQSFKAGIKNDDYFLSLLSQTEEVRDKTAEIRRGILSQQEKPLRTASSASQQEKPRRSSSSASAHSPPPPNASHSQRSMVAGQRRSSQPEVPNASQSQRSMTAGLRRGSQPEVRAKARSESQLFPRRSSGPNIALPRVSFRDQGRKGSMGLANSTDQKDHEGVFQFCSCLLWLCCLLWSWWFRDLAADSSLLEQNWRGSSSTRSRE